MDYEIDYLPVGEGQKSGDAICLRYGNLSGTREEQTVVVIDGGDKASGELMVGHIKQHYGTNRIDYMISTHPDNDHSSGLCHVIQNLEVGTLLMHQPWEHMEYIKEAFIDKRWTERGLSDKVQKALTHVSEIEDHAMKTGIPVIEPFQGYTSPDGVIHILGPSKEFYQDMLANFRSTPEAKSALGVFAGLIKKAEVIIDSIEDRFDLDLLNDEEDKTSAENNTSVIALFDFGGNKVLFTGDAGKTALYKASEYAENLDIQLSDLTLLHVPHHGSRRNINSSILKKINGSICHISASGENVKHPSKRVTNALYKHGAQIVNVTRKKLMMYFRGGNLRGWPDNLEKEPFHNYVEEE